MKRRFIAALLGVIIIVLAVHNIPLASYFSRVERDRLTTALERDAFILAGHAKESLNSSAGVVLPSLQPAIDKFSKTTRALVVVTDAAGLAVSSNDSSVEIGKSYINRPEVSMALTGVPATGQRASQTLGQTLVYVAVPVQSGDRVIGTVRLSYPKSFVDKRVQRQRWGILFVGAISLLMATIAAVLFANTLTRPLRRLTTATEKLSAGDMQSRASDVQGPPEIRELARSFNVMAGRLSAILQSQRSFAGDVSHQLRTPLTALRLRLEQAQIVAKGESKELREALDASRHETDRLQSMIEQLLALARLEGGDAPTVDADAALVAHDRALMWQPLAEEKNVTISVANDSLSRCRVVDGGLEQMIDNYVDNALSVSPSGSRIEITVRHKGVHVEIDVCDSGPGLTPEQCIAAFQRFWRSASTQNEGGSGLGLAIVQQLATASGGSAELLPRNDHVGLCARVTLLSAHESA